MESQNIEWKENWRDEYLKWICGFANAQGGCLEIGRNDVGQVVGLDNAEKLLEELPNKIRSTMGIIADVNLYNEDNLHYISIKVNAHPNAISYRGKYYYRSGSTNQELTGYALDEFILRKYGRTWDSSPVLDVDISDFFHDAFAIFREKAITSGRLTPDDVAINDIKLLQSLNLIEGNYLLKAAVLLFHQKPEKRCLGSCVKIGYFENEADLIYQDEIGGSLIGIADRVMDTIYTKYFKGLIHYEGIQRIDHYPIPREALREAVLNAVVHRDYSTGSQIQIKIFNDRVYIFNDKRLSANISDDDLFSAHKSSPGNPLIANTFFRSGQIEAWGRGIEKMQQACVKDNLPEPEFKITPTVFSICFHIHCNNKVNVVEEVDSHGDFGTNFGIDFGINFGINETQQNILKMLAENPTLTISTIADTLKMTKRNIEIHISKLKEIGLLERSGTKKNGRWIVKKQ
ncbi:MAG: putative DNA binding domain-containing protein [Holosporaceae bacterium]|nr:putative DNA binding domain-containing protein [Holosporaceae bacterium]